MKLDGTKPSHIGMIIAIFIVVTEVIHRQTSLTEIGLHVCSVKLLQSIREMQSFVSV
ncbi:hypothetical protein D3C85_1344670 [compost metagenome]